jgi:ubiquinone/menaquinone biosynthesis C-methylase UbiE
MAPEILQFGSDLEAMQRLIGLPGRRIVDVACGNGALAFALAERGASVLGIENDPRGAQVNRALGSFPRVTLVEGFAQNLPRNDGTVDCVIFAHRLSQTEAYEMDDCLAEACRVLAENDGILYVLERHSGGSYDDVVRLFYDESEERAWALDALARMPRNFFASAREIHYGLKHKFPDFDSFVAALMAADDISYAVEEVNTADVRAWFDQGIIKGGGYEFEQVMRVDIYRTGAIPPPVPPVPPVPAAPAAPASA